MPSSKTDPWERYAKLKYSLDGLVMSGARTVGWVNDQLQAAIDRPKPIEVPGLRPDEVECLVVFWEERFFGRGRAIVTLLGEFYSPTLSFAPTPPAADLEATGSRDMFWAFGQERVGVRAVAAHALFATDVAVDLGTSIKDHCTDRLQSSLGDVGWRRIAESLDESLENVLANVFFTSLTENLWADLGASRGQELLEAFGQTLYDGLRVSLFYAVGFAVTVDVGRDFGPLLARWRSGNLPVGHDREGNIVYLCASTPKPPRHEEPKLSRDELPEFPPDGLPLFPDEDDFWVDRDDS